MIQALPFTSVSGLLAAADRAWDQCQLPDLLEAFSHHPRIGGDVETLRKKFGSTSAWASQEQSGVQGASEEVLQTLSQGNLDYEKKFGFVFLICATGKSASEMLSALQVRLLNNKEQEVQNAKIEQGKITHIRIHKLLEGIQ